MLHTETLIIFDITLPYLSLQITLCFKLMTPDYVDLLVLKYCFNI